MRGILFVLGVALLLGLPTLAYSWTQVDSAIFNYLGATIREGGVPFVDAWDVKGPGTYYLYALSQVLFGMHLPGFRLFDLLWQIATALVLMDCGRRMYGERATVFTGCIYLFTYYTNGYWNLGQTDGLMCLPLATAFYFLLRAREEDSLLDWFATAGCLGVAMLLKWPIGILGVLMLLAAFWGQKKNLPRLLRRCGALLAGVATPLCLCLGYFAARGALGPFLATQLDFAPQFVARIHTYITFACARSSFAQTTLYPVYILGGLGFGSLLRRVWQKRWAPFAELFLVAWLVCTFVTIVLHGNYLGYHFLSLLMPVSLLAARSLMVATGNWQTGQRWGAGIALLLACAATEPAGIRWVQNMRHVQRFVRGEGSAGPLQELGFWLKGHTAPEDRIFVWGNSPSVYLYAERRSSSRFINAFYVAASWRNPWIRDTFWRELNAQKPKYFIVRHQKPENACSEAGLVDFQYSLEHYAKLNRLLETEYRNVRTTMDYTVLARN